MDIKKVGRPVPTGSRFELYSWIFMRISGILLIFLALGHLAIMHIINNVDTIDYEFVAARFTTPFWRIYDLLMLVLALFHGLNGARTMVEDYIHPAKWKRFTLSILYALGFLFTIVGSYTLLAFHPK